jgi:hypothetical protein
MALEKSSASEKQVEAGTWGVFFVWIGIAFLADLSWGVWLVGVGAILLGAQLARRFLALRIEGFWIVAGALFVIGGLTEVYPLAMDIPLIPLLCILAGVGLLVKAMRHGATPDRA